MAHTSKHPIFSVTVDIVCLTVRADRFEVLLVERGESPFQGQLAFPGGFVRIDEDLEAAARRELREETGIEAPRFLEQLQDVRCARARSSRPDGVRGSPGDRAGPR